jgi:hypothetical protein
MASYDAKSPYFRGKSPYFMRRMFDVDRVVKAAHARHRSAIRTREWISFSSSVSCLLASRGCGFVHATDAIATPPSTGCDPPLHAAALKVVALLIYVRPPYAEHALYLSPIKRLSP